jgi:hypothetical protein
MSHTTIYNVETGIVETAFEGLVTFEEVVQVMSEAATLAMEHDCLLWLNDFSDAQTQISATQIFLLPRKFEEVTRDLDARQYRIRRAMVGVDDSSGAHFAETTSINRGQRVRLFATIEEARDWLREEDRADGQT